MAQMKNMSRQSKHWRGKMGFDLDQVLGDDEAGGSDGQKPALGAPEQPLEQVQLN